MTTQQEMVEAVQIIIQVTQKAIWEAEYFISINANATYWEGHKSANEATLTAFRTVGINVSEIVSEMKKPVYNHKCR